MTTNSDWSRGQEWLTRREAADALGTSVQTIGRYIRNGQIAHMRMPSGRVFLTWGQIQEFLSARQRAVMPGKWYQPPLPFDEDESS